MYVVLNRFLLSHQSLDFRRVPDFFKLFYGFDLEVIYLEMRDVFVAFTLPWNLSRSFLPAKANDCKNKHSVFNLHLFVLASSCFRSYCLFHRNDSCYGISFFFSSTKWSVNGSYMCWRKGWVMGSALTCVTNRASFRSCWASVVAPCVTNTARYALKLQQRDKMRPW